LNAISFDGARRQKQASDYVRLAERIEAVELEPGDEGTESLH